MLFSLCSLNPMSRFKGNKFKRKEKQPRGGGFGFNKSKITKIFEGNEPKYDHFEAQHTLHEEIFVVDSGTEKSPQQPASFDQLPRISMTQLTNSVLDAEDLDESTEELGFFFDSTPSQPVESQIATKVKSNLPARASNNSYQENRSKIIQDDSIYIDSEDDADDADSISSSEDVDALQALAHWGKVEIFQEEPAGHQYLGQGEDDYTMLMGTLISDICDPDQDVIETLDSDEDHEPLKWQQTQEMYVPDSMKHSYRGLLKEERNRLKKQAKQQQKKRMTARMTVDKSVAKSGKKNIVDQVMHEFLQQDHLKRYRLSNLSYHGRRMVVPKLAKMFNLDISPVKSSKSCIDLVKTKKTCKPAVPKKSRAQNSITKHQSSSRMEKIQSRQDEKHGKQVASSSTPISTNNVGHRMLAAMGWKEGEAIGNSQKGIKEPIKVFMRANRRGLGA